MDQFHDCITVQPGTWNDTGPPPPDGGGGGWPGNRDDDLGIVDTVLPPGPPGPPGPPFIDPPEDCTGQPDVIVGCTDPLAFNYNDQANFPCIVGDIVNGCCIYEGGGQETLTTECPDTPQTQTFTFPFISFDLGDGAGAEGVTNHYIVPANGSIAEAATEFDLGIGELSPTFYDAIPCGSITAKIIDLPYGDTPSVPAFEVTIPTDLASMEYYASASIAHPSMVAARLVCSFDILYTYDLPNDNSDDFIEYYREHWFLTDDFNIIPYIDDDQEPTVTYSETELDVHYNSTAPPTVITPNTFDLAGNTIEDVTVITLPHNTPYDEDNGYVTVSPTNGNITLNSYPGNFGPPPDDVAPTALLVTFNFTDQTSIEIPSFGLNIISDEISEPNFGYDESVFYNVFVGPGAPESSIVPSVWENNSNTVNFCSVGMSQCLLYVVQGSQCGLDDVCWGGIDSDSNGFEDVFSFNPINGIITVAGWNTEQPPDPLPTGIQIWIQFWWETNNPEGPNFSGSIDLPLNIVFTQALTSSGGDGNTVTYLPFKGPGRKSKRLMPARGNRFSSKITGSTSTQRITSKAVPPDLQESAYYNIIYNDGLRNADYTFFNYPTFAPNFKENSAEAYNSIFRKKGIDFVVKNIMDINLRNSLYNDFSYNTITSTRVKASFQANVRKLLGFRPSLDGTLFLDKLGASVRQALINNEVDRYTLEEVEMLSKVFGGNTLSMSRDPAVNHRNAVSIMTEDSQSLNPNDYTIGDKNRLLNWKILAEDINKNIKLKTSDGTETTMYIPNAETIPVYDATGGAHTLEMQDGDYFAAVPVIGNKRLSVYSDRDKARVLSVQNIARASRLLGGDTPIKLTCSSVEDSLVELDVDTTGTRQEYYFLALDKSTIEDEVPDTLGFRKTKGVYNYLTSTSSIDDFVKHKAFPYLKLFLRDDDMIFNHLEVTNNATVSFNEPSLEYLENATPTLLVRRMPWYIMVVPTDMTMNVPSQARSQMVDFSTRSIEVEYSSTQENITSNLRDNPWLTETVITTGGINFDGDQIGNTIYQESRQYSINFTEVNNYQKYQKGYEVTPRKLTPTNALLKKLKELKSIFSLTDRDSITFYDLFTRLDPSEFRGLPFDQEVTANFFNKLRVNKVASTPSINKDNFVAVKDVYKHPDTPVVILDSSLGGSIFSKSPTVPAVEGDSGRSTRPGGPSVS